MEIRLKPHQNFPVKLHHLHHATRISTKNNGIIIFSHYALQLTFELMDWILRLDIYIEIWNLDNGCLQELTKRAMDTEI